MCWTGQERGLLVKRGRESPIMRENSYLLGEYLLRGMRQATAKSEHLIPRGLKFRSRYEKEPTQLIPWS
ncbi:MAG TPA: hypothetical protein DEP61_03145 [Lachnospiraceae bacterium]|nr:hypothetical protein [Lachnospiraceae bacterium]